MSESVIDTTPSKNPTDNNKLQSSNAAQDGAGNDTSRTYDARALGMQAIRATEEAAMAAYAWIGRGEEKSADLAAVGALRKALNRNAFNGRIVIGEGERDESPMLYIGEQVGRGYGPDVDIAVDPLEGTTICARNEQNAMSVLALAKKGDLLNAPDVYMSKLAAGPGIPDDLLSIDADPEVNIRALARFKNCPNSHIQVTILDRPRHKEIINKIYKSGARVKLITDGDIYGIIATSDKTLGIDMYMGIGGAPEGVLAAAAMTCVGGFFQGRLIFRNAEEWNRAQKCGIKEKNRIYTISDLAKGDVVFAATGITDGQFLKGIRHLSQGYSTHSVLMRSQTGTMRFIESFHNLRNKAWIRKHSAI